MAGSEFQCQPRAKSLLGCRMARRMTLKQHLEDAELPVHRGQRRLDCREGVAALERADRDTTKAKRYLRIFEKALVYQAIADGNLKPTKFGKKTLFLAPDLAEFLNRLRAA